MSEDVNNNLDQEEVNNIVSMTDEDGNDVKFEFIDLIELDGEEYVVLKLEKTDSEDEESYVSVEDEAVLNRVFEIFKEKFKDEFTFTD